jgi:4-amino-4-deoxy-L-arabinose transferase-like glycosyltransferase
VTTKALKQSVDQNIATKIGILILILLVAAVLRVVNLDENPPGIHVDEASNAWNAYTLLKTGKDEHGVRWPIFYTRAFGENHSAVILYALLPFQAVGGMNIWTTRLPIAVSGVICVLLIYFIGARLFGSATGLVAAAILAVNPWHLQMSRVGIESGLVPLLILGPLAALLWANMPFDDDEERRPRPVAAAIAGAVSGASCYGYWAVRLFLPIFVLAAVLVTWRAWWKRLKTREWRFAIGCLLIGGAVTFGPLVWEHLTDSEIGKRGQMANWVWDDSDSLGEKIGKVFDRYPTHFGLDFLFIRGDHHPAYASPAGTGLFFWYELPLMLVGLAILILRFKSSRAARFLLLWLVLYPAADLLNRLYPGPDITTLHSLRSQPGIGALVLLAAVGGVGAARWLWRDRRQIAVAIFSVMVFLVIELNAGFIVQYFGELNRQKYSHPLYEPDILEALHWVRPRLNEVDAVFVTGRAMRPYIVTLFALGYDPEQWFRDVREVVPGPLPNGDYRFEDINLRYGKIRFLYTIPTFAALKNQMENGGKGRTFIVVRPGELELDKQARPVYEVHNPQGGVVLQIFDLHL